MEEFQNRKFHKGREVSHLPNTNYLCLLSKSLEGALQKLFSIFSSKAVGYHPNPELVFGRRKKSRKGGRVVPTSANNVCPKNSYFFSPFLVYL